MFIPIYEVIPDYGSVVPDELRTEIHTGRPYERVEVGNDSDRWLIFDANDCLIPLTNDRHAFLSNDFTVYRQAKGATLGGRLNSTIHSYENRRMRPLNNMEVSSFHSKAYVAEANDHRIHLDQDTISNTVYRKILSDWKIEAVQKVTFELKSSDGTKTVLQNYGRETNNIPKLNIFLINDLMQDEFVETYPDAPIRKWAGGEEMLVNMNGRINILRFFSERNIKKLMEWGSNSTIAKMSGPDDIARDVRVMVTESANWLEVKYVAYWITSNVFFETRNLLDPIFPIDERNNYWVVVPFVEWGIRLKQHELNA